MAFDVKCHLCSLAPLWLIDFDSFLKVTETHPMKSTSDPSDNWYKIGNTDEVTSPSLLVYPDRIEANIKKMIGIGDFSHQYENIKPKHQVSLS